ncbi:hypothetical protein GCM10011492_23960 [Flexivirga endophytica]|uniref:Uncharacterized protein n=1 Tax=Flexivirga endophytica TaxID=1849103 RepID=A0A916WV49_9MICO|nr:hypothetical protein GCM10011492_23960 [Flexivirga endophytica]GHB53366.1 hypothetical protein GCM10008112_23240 [Flexivirga endophytica]
MLVVELLAGGVEVLAAVDVGVLVSDEVEATDELPLEVSAPARGSHVDEPLAAPYQCEPAVECDPATGVAVEPAAPSTAAAAMAAPTDPARATCCMRDRVDMSDGPPDEEMVIRAHCSADR